MKIYANVDLHGDIKELEKIKEKIKHADILVFAGDMTIFSRDINRVFSKLNKFGKTVLVIPGNHEDENEVKELSKKYKNIFNLHKKYFVHDNVLFLGHGGEGFSSRSKDFEKIMPRFEELSKKFSKVVLVLHQPPYNTKCDQIHGEKAGNKSYRDFIRKIQPELVICGHLHENQGKKDKIGKSLIVNPGWQGKFLKI